ncbi:MAG TPA: flagellar motor switch protein FliN [Planctomycetota bacterium]|nr:flagellar motor switch protein FliN [Planctomycetota bacterium]
MPDDLKQEDIDALLKAASGDSDSGTLAQQEVEALLKGADGGKAPAGGAAPVEAQFPELAGRPASADGAQGTFDLLGDVRLRVRIELGRRQMHVDDILRLSEGSVVELDKLAGDPVDVLVNDVLVARGEVLVLNDYFCVRVTEILSPKDRLASAG